jgi:transposase
VVEFEKRAALRTNCRGFTRLTLEEKPSLQRADYAGRAGALNETESVSVETVQSSKNQVGEVFASALIETAKILVGSQHSEAYSLQVKYTCSAMELLRNRVKQLDQEIERKLQDHEVGKLLTTIDGIGARTAACLIAELGDSSRFRSAAALASYFGVVPRLRQSGKRAFSGARGLALGNARLRHRLWMPTLVAVRKNPWLRARYDRLLAAGKRPKVALVACMRKLLTAV